MDDAEEKRRQLEVEILKIIEAKLSRGQIDEARVKAIAKMVLEKLHPPMTLEQLYQVAPTLDDEFAELSSAILPIMQERDEKLREVVSAHAEKLIKSGKIEEASAVIAEGLKGE